MRISDWSSDVCSSDLVRLRRRRRGAGRKAAAPNVASVREEEFADADGDKPARRAPAKKAPAKRASAKDDGVAEKPAETDAKPEARSEGRREGKECVSTCRSRRSPNH